MNLSVGLAVLRTSPLAASSPSGWLISQLTQITHCDHEYPDGEPAKFARFLEKWTPKRSPHRNIPGRAQ